MPHRRLRNYELQSLHPLLKSLADESEQVVERWHQLYANQCGETRALAEAEFSSIMLPLVRHSVTALLDSDYEGFGTIARALGERLAKRAFLLSKSSFRCIFARKALRLPVLEKPLLLWSLRSRDSAISMPLSWPKAISKQSEQV
jgi:hypothetical protein